MKLHAPYEPSGDQPAAIAQLTANFLDPQNPAKEQVLLGVTGSGKTFTMASFIQKIQKPTLVIAHNKTLAAQLYQEFRDFFPENAVSYFVSYYDYYQPEAYIVSSDTYIEKEATINDEIDKLRLAATANLLSRPDTIVVSSVSCIYNIGKPEDFGDHSLTIIAGELLPRQTLLTLLTDMQYQRTTADLLRGTFRLRGDQLQIWPANESWALRLTIPGDRIESIEQFDPTTGLRWIDESSQNVNNAPTNTPTNTTSNAPTNAPTHEHQPARRFTLYPAKHYMSAQNNTPDILQQIEHDMRERVEQLKNQGKIVEAYRLEQRTLHDIDMIREVGFVNGIENYSRYFDGREPGATPFSLLEYFQYNANKFGDGRFLTIIDESHITIPQIRGMYAGDRSRKETLVEYGFRLPAAMDNRPLRFDEFQSKVDTLLYVSATPGEWELAQANGKVVEQIVRPTGLVDPPITIRPIAGQIPDLLGEILVRKQRGQRVLVTTLTKKMAETLTDYLNNRDKMLKLLQTAGISAPVEQHPKVQYLHSDVETLERSEILAELRRGEYDVLIGVNLLREGLDLPEVTLVAILDADQEGFLRSRSALIQTMGRAARHVEGQVILYADKITDSMQGAIDEVDRRRQIQIAYNQKNGIVPQTISKPIREQLIKREKTQSELPGLYEKKHQHFAHGRDTAVGGHGSTVVALTKTESVVLDEINPEALTPADKKKLAARLTRVMNKAAVDWNFELAARIRDTIARLQ